MAEAPDDYYRSDPDWAAYAQRHGLNFERKPLVSTAPLDPSVGRASQEIQENKWAREHPVELVGYRSGIQHVTVRDGYAVEIKVLWPVNTGSGREGVCLPLLFVCHGGGWFQGTHTTEEAWLLWPLMTQLQLVIVSVAYRLAPEYPYPTYINDCWDVFQAVTMGASSFQLMAPFDRQKILLGGSSAGALIAATLSQKVLKHKAAVDVCGVVLNVPVTCDYRFWPADHVNQSYRECEAALLTSAAMRQVWDLVVPPGAGSDPQASPLLGISPGLPPHLIYVAGQDPLRDEGIEYAHTLSKSDTPVKLRIYPGVPHTFGEMWELKATQKFWADIVGDIRALL